MKYELAIKENI